MYNDIMKQFLKMKKNKIKLIFPQSQVPKNHLFFTSIMRKSVGLFP